MNTMTTAAFTAALSLATPVVDAAPPPTRLVADAWLRAANHAHVQAFIAGDAKYFETLLDEDFRFTALDGSWLDRAGYIALGRQPPPIDAVSYDDVEVQLYGAVGIVHATVVYVNARGALAKTRYTDVYRWDGARWRLVSAQLSPIADPAKSALIVEAAPAHAGWRGAAPAGDDRAVLAELNANYVRAFLESDVAWYDAHLAADYRVVFGDGSFHDKGSLLANAAQPVTAFAEFPTESVAIRVFGDIALIHAENPYTMHDGRQGVSRYTDVWHKQDGRWRCVAAHVTRHKPPQ